MRISSYFLFLHLDQWIIKGLSEAMSAVVVAQVSIKFLRTPSKISFGMEKVLGSVKRQCLNFTNLLNTLY